MDRGPFLELEQSHHWIVFTALALTMNVRRVLEIGTFDGEFTSTLARLFPDAEVVTIDLPDADSQVRATYNRVSDTSFDKFLHKRAENLSLSNITSISRNSFYLPEIAREKFDVIWLDGDHTFPALGWDFCNAYHLLEEGGVIVCDDVYRYPVGDRSPRAHSKLVLDYLAEREIFKVDYVLKRLSRADSADPWHRKYLGLLKK
ncbi:class I SAM-dependent methyltransferase [Burkholderiales bacterium]|nr:class I SAM-dependent methyltransferase [Burkholderiales bacterium]